MIRPLQVALRALAMGILAAAALPGQTVLSDPHKVADAAKIVDALGGKRPSCQVLPLGPRFLFSLRVQAGYVARLPGQGDEWIALTRITPTAPKGGPFYLSQVVALPSGRDPIFEGSYWLGKGRYAVKFVMFDSKGAVCEKDWQVDARLNSRVTNFKPILAPGTVEGSSGTGTRAARTKPFGPVTILLHAAAVLQMQTTLGKLDKVMLLDGMVALMDELSTRPVRLVVFNLEQQKELLRMDNFTLDRLPEVARALDAVQPAAVDYRAAQNANGPADFVTSLLIKETHISEPSDAVVFLGPKSVYKAKPSLAQAIPPGAKQRFFYLECDPTRFFLPRSSTLNGGNWGAQGQAMGISPPFPGGGPLAPTDVPNEFVFTNYGPNHGADTIEYAVARLAGKTLKVDSPASFAEAVAKILR